MCFRPSRKWYCRIIKIREVIPGVGAEEKSKGQVTEALLSIFVGVEFSF